MDRTRLTTLIVCTLWLACSERESTVTEKDAISLGYERIECSELPGYFIYGQGIGDFSGRPHCEAAVTALGLVRESGLVPAQALSANATGVIVVETRAIEDQSNEPSDLAVIFDLYDYGQNVAVEPASQGELPIISWVQEGLRY